MNKTMSSFAEFLDAVLMIGTAGFLFWLSYVAIDGLYVGDISGAGASAALAVLNGLISLSAFRRLRASFRARRAGEP